MKAISFLHILLMSDKLARELRVHIRTAKKWVDDYTAGSGSLQTSS